MGGLDFGDGGGIEASYSLALPDVGVGVFALQNLALSAGVNIPFDGTPVRVRFGLSSRDNPFILTIDLFGGGGFFSLAIGADGIEMIEVSLEFGADLSIDLGVASGGVSIMAGIYFALQTVPTKQVQLTGFLRADGNLSVLGIISISMEFYLGFTYLDPGKAYGTATVSVSVSVLFSQRVSKRDNAEDNRRKWRPGLQTGPDREELGNVLWGFRMTRQRVLWTACPHGKAADGKLRVWCMSAPQLFPTGNKVSTLAEFHDWAKWPSTKVAFKVRIGPSNYDADIVSTAPSLPLWQSLFPLSTKVDPYEYSSPTRSALYSYPAGFVRHFFQSTYTALVGTEPVGGFPGVQQLTSEDVLGVLPLEGRELLDEIEAVKARFPKGGGPIPPGTGPSPASDLTQAYLFLQPLSSPPRTRSTRTRLRPRSRSSTSTRRSRFSAPPGPAPPFRARLRAGGHSPEQRCRVWLACPWSRAGCPSSRGTSRPTSSR